MYLQLRRRLWYALHEIPADVRPVLGRPRFCRSLETENRKTAERRAAILEQRWRREIEQARGAVVAPLEEDEAGAASILRALADGQSVAQIARDHGVSRQTVMRVRDGA